ncbi:unnamed protein product [Auanema sp. JU1783]|nr:unnamed protein product [Auanema sp. JU1783]
MLSRNFIIAAILLCIGVSTALDCRKFSFAPACRGIMLKRSSDNSSEHPLSEETALLVGFLIKEAESMGYTECVPVRLMARIFFDLEERIMNRDK